MKNSSNTTTQATRIEPVIHEVTFSVSELRFEVAFSSYGTANIHFGSGSDVADADTPPSLASRIDYERISVSYRRTVGGQTPDPHNHVDPLED